MAFPLGLQSDLRMLSHVSGTLGVYLDPAARPSAHPPAPPSTRSSERMRQRHGAGRLPGKKQCSADIPRIASLRTSGFRIGALHSCIAAGYRRTRHCAMKYVRVIAVRYIALTAEVAHRRRRAGDDGAPAPSPLAWASRVAWISLGYRCRPRAFAPDSPHCHQTRRPPGRDQCHLRAQSAMELSLGPAARYSGRSQVKPHAETESPIARPATVPPGWRPSAGHAVRRAPPRPRLPHAAPSGARRSVP